MIRLFCRKCLNRSVECSNTPQKYKSSIYIMKCFKDVRLFWGISSAYLRYFFGFYRRNTENVTVNQCKIQVYEARSTPAKHHLFFYCSTDVLLEFEKNVCRTCANRLKMSVAFWRHQDVKTSSRKVEEVFGLLTTQSRSLVVSKTRSYLLHVGKKLYLCSFITDCDE